MATLHNEIHIEAAMKKAFERGPLRRRPNVYLAATRLSAYRSAASQNFQQLALALVTGDVSGYQSTLEPNTHWRHWPDGGTL